MSNHFARLGKKCFPSYETFPFDDKLRKQRDAAIFSLTDMRRVLWHIPFKHTRTVGEYLINQNSLRAKIMSYRTAELDEAPSADCGLSQLQKLSDFYSAGQNVIRMVVSGS